MTRAETTKFLGKLLTDTRLGGAGSHWASEVSIDPWTPKARRVDYMEFSPANQCSVSGIEKGIFTCYEIKSCKEDVYSGNGLNFFGEKNYIVTTMECYKNILPDFRSGRFANYMSEKHPDSSTYYGIMVAIPFWGEVTEEFNDPTPSVSYTHLYTSHNPHPGPPDTGSAYHRYNDNFPQTRYPIQTGSSHTKTQKSRPDRLRTICVSGSGTKRKAIRTAPES